MEFTDEQINRIMIDVKAELYSANNKFPPFNSSHEGYAVLLEEVDEMFDDIKKDLISHSILEALQVAAMAIKYIASMELINNAR